MAYWGLARTGLNWFTRGSVDTPELKRYLDFLNEAVRRKDSSSARERMYIEAWATAFTGENTDRLKVLARELQKIVLKYPDDLEAKSLYALFSIEPDNALGTERVLREVFEKEPDHPGAHHYRIHNWDVVAPDQGLPSCLAYGRVAPNIGHADHMPGHNYSKIGLWHEAARSMDSATRVELRYMNERLALPFETWNYAHNRNYLCYIQEQLGMAQAALQGARDLIAAPRDPEANKDESYGAFDQGLQALVRALIKFERWDDILFATNTTAIPWRDLPADRDLRAYSETLAYVGKGDLASARFRLQDLKKSLRQQEEKSKGSGAGWAIGVRTAEGLLRAAEGDLLEATRLLSDAASLEMADRKADRYADDPPAAAWPLYRLLGDVYLAASEHRLAVAAYQRSLETLPNDVFALSGLARARFALGDKEAAQTLYSRMLYEWSGADPDLRWMKSVEALGMTATAKGETLIVERPYQPASLAHLGPNHWEPYAAPRLEALDSNGVSVRLQDYRGTNVILVFFLGDECVHCMEQLTAINARSSDWAEENTVVLGVSSARPEASKGSAKLSRFNVRLLSDPDHANARRFASYDDFEEIELHSTVLLDTQGRVHWKRTGGKPFADVEFLLKSVKRMNGHPITSAEGSTPAK